MSLDLRWLGAASASSRFFPECRDFLCLFTSWYWWGGVPPSPRSIGIMGLGSVRVVKYRFQVVYRQNLDNIGVRGHFSGAELGWALKTKELRLTKSRKI